MTHNSVPSEWNYLHVLSISRFIPVILAMASMKFYIKMLRLQISTSA